MGGSAFKDKFTGVPVNRRMESKQDFLDTFNAQVDLFGHLFPMRLPHQINSKTSFGDIDIIVPTGHLEAVYAVLRENELPFFTNGIVVSYLTHDKVQIDLINIEPSKIEYAVKYFSYGDHGNILGRILKHELNVKNSFNGLYYIYRNERFKRDILLTMDYNDVFKLLSLDKEPFYEGFETEYDLFNWIATSPLIKEDAFKLENLTNKDRTRDRKRKFYNQWVAYLLSEEYKKISKNKHPEFDLYSYPHLEVKYNEYEKEFKDIKSLYNKFNGGIVMELTNLTGKDLGNFIANFKRKYTDEYLNSSSEESIKQIILKEYENFKIKS